MADLISLTVTIKIKSSVSPIAIDQKTMPLFKDDQIANNLPKEFQ